MLLAAIAVPDDGTISINAGSTDETITIGSEPLDKAVRLEAVGGTVVIGQSTGKRLATAAKADAAGEPAPLAAFLDALRASLAVAGAEDGLDGAAGQDGAVRAGRVYATAMPFVRAPTGAQLASPDAALAVRVRGGAPGTVWADAAGGVGTLHWQPADGDPSSGDVWVICRPEERWTAGSTVRVEGGVFGVSAAREFDIEAPVDSAGALWQPVAGVDYVAREDGAEASGEVRLSEPPLRAPMLAPGIDAPWLVGPQRVYSVPQRVWLPMPDGVEVRDLRLYYYHPEGEGRGWYPAERVEGSPRGHCPAGADHGGSPTVGGVTA